ncbi:hypothetical protein HK098_005639 [Nowakowskiella sp. JEL0407]|nr:hypothetical protein HK098_005639 [Nowakowskiella sp. JEL0407]
MAKEFSVAIAIRPFLKDESPSDDLKFSTSSTSQLEILQTTLNFRNVSSTKTTKYLADHLIFDEGQLKQLYETTCKQVLQCAFNGGIGTIFAYGQTNSGKTYTISHICEFLKVDIFTEDIEISVSAIEILGNSATDLVSSDSENPVKILEDRFNKLQILNSSTINLHTIEDFENFMTKTLANRKTSATFKNDQSSRSHAFFRFEFKNSKIPQMEPGVLNIIDLAGSERASKDSMFHSKEQQKESVEINRSLMVLKECILRRSAVEVMDKSGTSTHLHIPYRNSKLTLLLKDAFEMTCMKPCMTLMIATISPVDSDLSATTNTLRYASSLYAAPPRIIPPPDANNPATWTHEQVLSWLREKLSEVDPTLICPTETGIQFCRVGEAEFINRIMVASGQKIGYKRANAVYLALWKEVVDARTRLKKTEKKKWDELQKIKRREDDEYYVRIYETGHDKL